MATVMDLTPTERIACPVCESAQLTDVDTQQPHLKFFGRGVLLRTELHVTMCDTCGLLLQSPRLSSQMIQDLYRRTAHYEVGTCGIDRPQRDAVARLQIDFACKGGLSLDARSVVAEIGGSGGHLLELLKSTGATRIGVELSERDCEFARAKGITMICGAWEDVEFPYQADLIFASHVLEHVSAPDRFLRKIADSLNPSGLVYLELENM